MWRRGRRRNSSSSTRRHRARAMSETHRADAQQSCAAMQGRYESTRSVQRTLQSTSTGAMSRCTAQSTVSPTRSITTKSPASTASSAWCQVPGASVTPCCPPAMNAASDSAVGIASAATNTITNRRAAQNSGCPARAASAQPPYAETAAPGRGRSRVAHGRLVPRAANRRRGRSARWCRR